MEYKRIIRFDSLDSTNNYLKNHLSEYQSGDFILAYTQTKGRGQHNNLWESKKGNLYFSYLIKKRMNRDELFFYLMKSSLSVVKTLETFNIKAMIKYPNDILVNNKKISGILIESLGYEEVEALIIGIGINVNQKDFPEYLQNPTSIVNEINQIIDVDEVMNEYLKKMELFKDSEDIYKQYLEKSLILGKNVVHKGIKYHVSNILNDGKIQIQDSSTIKTVNYEEIKNSIKYL